MKSKLFYYLAPFLLRPLGWFSPQKSEPGYRILLLHNIDQMENFEKIIDFIGDNYEFLLPQEIKKPSSYKGGNGKPKIMISFDDGFLSSALATRKILDPRGIKALFFLTPNFIELKGWALKAFIAKNIHAGRIGPEQVADGLHSMDWSEAESLLKSGHTIGAHTLNHAVLSSLPSKEAKQREIIGGGDMLENKLGVPVEMFAYPIGDNNSIDEESYKIIEQRYHFCYTGLRGKNTPQTSPYHLCRDHLDLNAPLDYIKFIINGGLDFYYIANRTR